MRKDARQNQKKILTTARQLFSARGVDAVSMKDIASAAGIGAGTLYRHYAHKSTLCLALVTDRVRAFITDCDQYLITSQADAVEQFNVVLGRYLSIREANMALLTNVEAGEPGRLQFYQSELYRDLAQLFRRVISNLTPGLTTATLTFRTDMLIAMLKSTSYAFQRNERQLSQTEILTELRQLLQS
ncbi:TetR/AcrR family transcriptional regulator [Lactiplantibacillus garii]|uniref:TetR/AcrR family transcriptional regulator n=1 Tax=Lactiplantibacillus garii TaxID=2306423 RepID=A0A426D712_9LACO|nr:TetR/AcrR family transcriptional regulator [Lactiplantibacillus garii]RRK10289.1 TetR/AcrR family transcriptional regulator [Lactiplantibacillus garii]